MRKGISLSIVGGVIISLVGVFILLSVFSDSFGSSFETTYCRVYRSITYVFPGGETPPPSACETGSSTDYKGVQETDPDDLALKVASAAVNCWERYNGYQTEKEVCEGWNVLNLEGEVSKELVMEKIQENDLCQQIGGAEEQEVCNDQLSMEGSIEKGEFVIIQYRYNSDETHEYIEVK